MSNKIPLCPFKKFTFNNDKCDDEYFMKHACNEALKAWAIGEIPIGAIAVIDDKIIARAHNLTERAKNATAHAEMLLINKVSKKIGDWRLSNTTLYVTKEPCPMCSGAIFKSRIKRVVIGLVDERQGCLGGKLNFNNIPLNHTLITSVTSLNNFCETLLKTFFELRRN